MNNKHYHYISRAEAKSYNLKKYYTGKECIHGHVSERYTISGKCLKCQQIQSKSWNSDHPEYFEKWRTDNPDKIREKYVQDYEKNYVKWILKGAHQRAKKKGIPFTLQTHDINIPDVCPVLGIELQPSKGSPSMNSPSIDRIIPELGYTKENTIVVSFKANMIKSVSSIDELRKVYEFYNNLI